MCGGECMSVGEGVSLWARVCECERGGVSVSEGV